MPLYDGNHDDLFASSKKTQHDPGLDKRRMSKKDREKEKENDPKKINKSARFALRPERMFFKEEEKQMYAEYFNRFKKDVEDRYTDFTTAQEVLVDALCYAIVRLERKSRLESFFGRFFDRVAPHDPLGQINSTLKSLGLLSTPKDTRESNSAQEIKKILKNDAENAELGIGVELTHEQWLKSLEDKQLPVVELRTPEEIPTYLDSDLVFSEDDEDNLEDDELEDGESEDI